MDAAHWHDPRLLETRTLDTPVRPPRHADLAAWESRRHALRTQILAAAGLWQDPAERVRTPPVAAVFDRADHPDLGYSVEKVHFESLPGFHVTGNLYRPSGGAAARAPARRAAILHPHGHARAGRFTHDANFSAPMRCITFARMGCVAFTHDMAGYGDSTRIVHRWGGPREWLWGATPLGLQLWNSIRALDFLASLPDVDPERLGCTGESGGGTQTFLLTAVDPRVQAAAPVNMVSLHMQGGCVCENAPGLRLDTSNVEIAALAAPRPLLLVSASGDWTADTPRLEYPAVAAVYGLYGAADRVGTVQFDAPHNYNRDSRQAVYEFFARWLPGWPGVEVPREEDVPGPDPAERLQVFFGRAWPASPEGPAAVEAVARWYRRRAEDSLAAHSPHDASSAAALRSALLPYLQAVAGVDAVLPAGVEAREEGDLLLLRRRGRAERFAMRRGNAEGAPVRLTGADGAEHGIWPFGTEPGGRPWARSGRAAEADFFLCYNRADAAWRAQDLLTALAWAGGTAKRLVADRDCAVGALLARAVAGSAVAALDVALGPEWAGEEDAPWLASGNYLPGVLRAGGLGGLLAMGAPGPVRLRSAGTAALAGVRALYAEMGAADAIAVE